MKCKIKKKMLTGLETKLGLFLSRPDFPEPSITDQMIHIDPRLHKKTSQH